MSRKSRGINAERELVHMFWKQEWACVRVAGSGSIKYPCPDLLAGNNIRKIVIESKLTKDNKKYFSNDDIDQIKQFSVIFGAEAWLAIKFPNQEWKFINPEDLNETKGNNYCITKSTSELKGLNFSELISL